MFELDKTPACCGGLSVSSDVEPRYRGVTRAKARIVQELTAELAMSDAAHRGAEPGRLLGFDGMLHAIDAIEHDDRLRDAAATHIHDLWSESYFERSGGNADGAAHTEPFNPSMLKPYAAFNDEEREFELFVLLGDLRSLRALVATERARLASGTAGELHSRPRKAAVTTTLSLADNRGFVSTLARPAYDNWRSAMRLRAPATLVPSFDSLDRAGHNTALLNTRTDLLGFALFIHLETDLLKTPTPGPA